jgi:nicotinate phosphoribosyltransferase
VMRGGRRIASPPPLAEVRALAARELRRLPEPLRRLEAGAAYPVAVAPALEALAAAVDRRGAEPEGRR